MSSELVQPISGSAARTLRRIDEVPTLGAACARLRRRSGRPEDSCGHVIACVRTASPTLPSQAGRGSRIRTCDPLLPKQMRYQAAPCPVRPLGRCRMAIMRRWTEQRRPGRPAPPQRRNMGGGPRRPATRPIFAAGRRSVRRRRSRAPLTRSCRSDRGSVSAAMEDPAVLADEDHVERDVGVLHPHVHDFVAVEIEQHAAIGGM